MPLYEYRCSLCGKSVEIIQKTGEVAPLCPNTFTGSADFHEHCMKKQISARTSFILNGKNWSKDNYGLKSK